MYITVYVDIETFHTLVINNKPFNACLSKENGAFISVIVPLEFVFPTNEIDMVLVKDR